MRVCVLVFDFPLWSETFIVDHADALLRAGHEVSIVPLLGKPVTDVTGARLARVVEGAGPFRPLPQDPVRRAWQRVDARVRLGAAAHRYASDQSIRPPGTYTQRLRIASRVKVEGPFDIIHAQFGTTAAAAVGLHRHGITGAPIVCSIHGTDANVTAKQDPARFASLMDDVAFVTVGTGFMGGVVEQLGVDATKIRRWPQGVDVDRAVPMRHESEGFRVLSASRLVAFKGVDDSLRVIAAARDRIPGLRYTVIGDGPMREELEQLARALGVDDITTFAGHRSHDDVLAAHAETDVFLQMGIVAADGSTEGQGVAPAEASISELPCLVTTSGGLPEVVQDRETGIVVNTGDVAAGADALVELAIDRDLRRRLGTRGRVFVRDTYSIDASTNTIMAIYDEARRVSR